MKPLWMAPSPHTRHFLKGQCCMWMASPPSFLAACMAAVNNCWVFVHFVRWVVLFVRCTLHCETGWRTYVCTLLWQHCDTICFVKLCVVILPTDSFIREADRRSGILFFLFLFTLNATHLGLCSAPKKQPNKQKTKKQKQKTSRQQRCRASLLISRRPTTVCSSQ